MNNKNRFNSGIILLVISIITFFSASASAEKITLTDAFLTALKNNIELNEKVNQINSLEKDLEIVRAQQSWNINISGEYNEVLNEAEKDYSNNNTLEERKTLLNLNREFSSGFSLNQQLNYSDNDGENYLINFNKRLLPITDSNLEQEYFIKSRELLISESEYKNLKENKIIDWVEDYLNILRLSVTQKNLERSVNKAKNNFEDLMEKAEVGEAAKSEVLNAEITYLDAENEYFDIDNQFANAKKSFELNLGLDKDQDLIYDQNASLLNLFENILYNYEENNINNLYDKLLSTDSELKVQQLNITILEKNLEWIEDDAKLNLDLNGSYNQSSEESILGLSISYDFYDGGANELRQQKVTDEIEIEKRKIENLKRNKYLQLESSINNIKSAVRTLRKNDLSLKKDEHLLTIRKEQLSDGSIENSEVLKAEIDYYSSLNEYHKSRDQLLIEELSLVRIISDKIINTVGWSDQSE